MRTDYTIDNVRVIAPRADCNGHGTNVVKAGKLFVFDDGLGLRTARSLGRVSAPALGDQPAIKGFVLAMCLSHDATYCYERWVDPKDITRVVDAPHKLAAFFFAPELPYAPATMRRLMDYGTTQEQFINKAAHHAEAWANGVSPAIYKQQETSAA